MTVTVTWEVDSDNPYFEGYWLLLMKHWTETMPPGIKADAGITSIKILDTEIQ